MAKTIVTVDQGGTGAETLTDGGVLLGSGTGAVTATAVLADGEMLVGDGTTDPALESGATLRTSIGVDASGVDNSTNVTLASVTGNYLALSGQEVTAGTVPLTLGGTGSTTASAARTALGVDASGVDNSTNVTLAGTPDYITISGQTITRAQVDLTADVTGTLPAGNGGTGLTSTSTLLNSNVTPTSLSLVIGSDVQAYDADTAKLDVAQTFTAGQRGEVTALTDASTVVLNFDASNNFSLLTTSLIGATRALGTPSNITAGQSGCIVITSDAASRLLTYTSAWHFEDGADSALTTDSGGVDTLVYYCPTNAIVQAVLLKDFS